MAVYLQSLGKEIGRYLERTPGATQERLQRYARDALMGWTAGTTVEGIWLRYVERLRPGSEQQFTAEADRAVAELGKDPPGDSPADAAADPAGKIATQTAADEALPASPLSPIVTGLKQIGIGLACGLIPWSILVALKVGDVIAIPSLALGAIAGYAIGGLFLRSGGISERRRRERPARDWPNSAACPSARRRGWRGGRRSSGGCWRGSATGSTPTPPARRPSGASWRRGWGSI